MKPIQILRFAGILKRHEGSDNHLVMRPPQFHIMFIGLRRSAQAVNKVQQSAIFFVPAAFCSVSKQAECFIAEFIILQPLGFFE